jgi:hypothetical protein
MEISKLQTLGHMKCVLSDIGQHAHLGPTWEIVQNMCFFKLTVYMMNLTVFWVWNCRIPFAAIILSKVLLVTARYPGLYFVSYCAVFLAACWTAIWIFGATGAVSLPYGGYYVALLIISLAWSIEVLRNIVNVTVAGTVGTFYFQV